MKKYISIILIFVLCLSLWGCANADAPAEQAGETTGKTVLTNVPAYAPGVTVKTSFGEIMVMDVAVCSKAQLIDALPHPAYLTAAEGRIVFAMRTRITNSSGKDLVLLDDLKVSISYDKENTFGCSKGGNYKSSDPLYTILPAGASGEYILCGRIPADLYQSQKGFQVILDGAELAFSADDIPAVNVMGYQEGDNATASLEAILSSAGTASAEQTENGDTNATAPADLHFVLEDSRYEQKKSYLAIEVKIRNDSDSALIYPMFKGVILDENGDILENCFCAYSNGLEPGQAGWEVIRISEETTIEAMKTIKLITMWDKENAQASYHSVRFDLPEPLVLELDSVKKK